MKYYQIIYKETNPDTEAMIDAFTHTYSDYPKTVKFTLKYPDKSEAIVDVMIQTLSYESDSPGSFLVRGRGKGINLFYYDSNCRSGYALPDEVTL